VSTESRTGITEAFLVSTKCQTDDTEALLVSTECRTDNQKLFGVIIILFAVVLCRRNDVENIFENVDLLDLAGISNNRRNKSTFLHRLPNSCSGFFSLRSKYMKNRDWFPSTRAEQNVVFANFNAKIDDYKNVFGLTEPLLAKLHTICETFLEVYQKVEQNRAAGANLTSWQDTIFIGTPKGDPVPQAPKFAVINVPVGAFIGIFAEFREIVGFIKSNPNYTENIGLDLMIVAPETEQSNLNDASPNLKLALKNDVSVEIAFKKADFDAIEIQYRKASTENWLPADKATTSPTTHTPQLTVAGQAEKFEYRATYLQKNQRVGNWSPIYSITVG
jgi:hypothetical protein